VSFLRIVLALIFGVDVGVHHARAGARMIVRSVPPALD